MPVLPCRDVCGRRVAGAPHASRVHELAKRRAWEEFGNDVGRVVERPEVCGVRVLGEP